MDSISLILSSLIHNPEFVIKTLPFLKEEYFITDKDKYIFKLIEKHYTEYNTVPTSDVLEIYMSGPESANLQETLYEQCMATLDTFKEYRFRDQPVKFLVDEAEKYCRSVTFRMALMAGSKIVNDVNADLNSVYTAMKDSVNLRFDNDLGIDFKEKPEDFYDYLFKKERVIQMGLDVPDRSMGGGVQNFGLYVWLANTNVGKTTMLASNTAHFLRNNKKVLFITLEDPDMRIQWRVSSNLMRIPMLDMKDAELNPKDSFVRNMNNINKNIGELQIKFFPPGSLDVNVLDAYLKDLQITKNFTPDVIMIDYISLLNSVRMKKAQGSYEFIKSVAEELRGLSIVRSIPVITAAQTNRNGNDSVDFSLTDTSESYGLPMTADWICGIGENEELRNQNQWTLKILKTRYSGMKNFEVGVFVDKSIQLIEDNPLDENSDEAPIDGNNTPIRDGYEQRRENVTVPNFSM